MIFIMFARYLIISIIVLCLMINTSSNIINKIFGAKSCPSPQLFTSLKVEPFIGKWYNHIALPNIFEKGKCGTTNYYYDAKNTTLYNQDKELRGNKWVTSPLATVTNDKPGVLTLHMTLASAEFNVLDTDYSSYAIVYSCKNLYVVDPWRFAWILTRKANPTEEEKLSLYSKAEALFKSADISISDLKPVLQDCPDN